jgi:alkylation response protein AidB-like acyl-CoA dehydrogenase
VSLAPTERAAEAEPVLAWLREFAARRVNSVLWDERRCLPPYAVIELGNHGVLGMLVPKSLGGLGFGRRAAARVTQQLSAIDSSLATMVGIHSALGVFPILHFARPEVREELIPQLARGRMLGALAMTERGAGSNPWAITTRADEQSGQWCVNGSKIWIGNGSWAGVINVFARRYVQPERPEGLVGLILRAGNTGLSMGPEALTMGMRSIVQNEMTLKDAVVPFCDTLGEPGFAHDVANITFNEARFGIGALAAGTMRRALQWMHRYAERRTTASPMLQNATVLKMLADAVAATEAVSALIDLTAADADVRGQLSMELAIACKVTGAELAWRVLDDAVQLLGGRGYIEANLLPQLFRDARLFRIFEGPSEVLERHLGGALLDKKSELEATCSALGGREFAARVLRDCDHLANVEGPPETTSPSLLRQARASAIGHYACLGVLSAAARTAEQVTGRAAASWARQWTDAELRAAFDRGRALIHSTPAIDLPTLTEVLSFTETLIGDTVRALPAEDYALDGYLIP